MCDLSLIIVSWNARAYLVQALESIAATAGRRRVEVIVVDNDSSDGSPEAVEAGFPEVRLIRAGANLGFAKANNLGIQQSRGRLVGLVNSDVTVLPECLERLVEFMDAHPRVGMAGPEVLNPDGSRQNSHWDFPSVGGTLARVVALDTVARKMRGAREKREERAQREEREEGKRERERERDGSITITSTSTSTNTRDTSTEASTCVTSARKNDGTGEGQGVDVLSGCFMVLRREALEEVGLLDEDFYIYGEDMDLCRRFHAAGWEVVYSAGARAIHAGGGSSANAPIRFFIELQKANLHYWTKHHGRAGRLFFMAAMLIQHLLRLITGVIIYVLVPHLRPASSQKIKRSAACIKWIFRREPAKELRRDAGSPERIGESVPRLERREPTSRRS